jgi:hypothetical protein
MTQQGIHRSGGGHAHGEDDWSAFLNFAEHYILLEESEAVFLDAGISESQGACHMEGASVGQCYSGADLRE